MLADQLLILASALRLGRCTEAEQLLISRKLEEFAARVRRTEVSLDCLVQDAWEDELRRFEPGPGVPISERVWSS